MLAELAGVGTADAFVVTEEEELVFADGAADAGTEDIVADNGFDGGEELIGSRLAGTEGFGVLLVGVEFVVLQIVVGVAVELVGA